MMKFKKYIDECDGGGDGGGVGTTTSDVAKVPIGTKKMKKKKKKVDKIIQN
jgi:hypothetical protein